MSNADTTALSLPTPPAGFFWRVRRAYDDMTVIIELRQKKRFGSIWIEQEFVRYPNSSDVQGIARRILHNLAYRQGVSARIDALIGEYK